MTSNADFSPTIFYTYDIRRTALVANCCFSRKKYFTSLAPHAPLELNPKTGNPKHKMGRLKEWAKNRLQRTKSTNGAHEDCLNVSPTAESSAPNPSELSATENSVKPSGPPGNLDKLSKPDSVNCNATTVSGLPEFPQAEKTIPDPSSCTTPTSSSDSDNPWELAYGILQAREPKLVEAYQAHLRLAQHDNSVHTNLSNPRSVQSVMTKLLEDREKKQWRVSLLGKDVKIREQTEKLAKFLLWADPIVKSAVSTQPYAALAWAGVSLLLPVGHGNPIVYQMLTRIATLKQYY